MPKRTVCLSAIGTLGLAIGILAVLSHPAVSATGSARRQTAPVNTPRQPTAGAETLAPPQPGVRTISRQNLSPMHQEIFAALDQEKARVEELNAQATKNMPASEFLALQQQIEETKKAGQISVLEIQLRYAEQEGRQAQVAELSEALEMIRHPLPPEEAVKRLRTQ
jgi:hypothetical protein